MPRASRWNQQNAAEFAMIAPQSNLASVSSAALARIESWNVPPRKGHEWQRDAFSFNELIGEIGYLNNLVANLVSTCDLRVVERRITPYGVEVEDSTDGRAARVMAAFTGPQGGQKELKRRAAMHLQIAGESFLLGTPLADKFDRPAGFMWEFLSTEEIRVTAGKGKQQIKRNASGLSDGDAGFVDVEAFIARLWRPDPRYSMRADSPMKRVLPICRELVVLSEVVDSIAKSRLSSGMLFIPEEMSFGPISETEAPNDSDDFDEFIGTLVEHMSAPVRDRTSAAGLVPLVVRGAAEFGDKIRLIELAQDLDVTYQSLRMELLDRLAKGLDAPPEIIGGKAGLNHWSSYNVDADLIGKHVNPVGEMIAEFITVAYLRPMLSEFEHLSDEDVLRFELLFDSRILTSRQDEGPAATGAWDRMALSDATYLRANGFDMEDYPTDEERQRRLLEKVVLSDPRNFGPRLLPALYPELARLFMDFDLLSVNAPEATDSAAPAALPADPVNQPLADPGAMNRAPAAQPDAPKGIGGNAPPVPRPDGKSSEGLAVIDDLVEALASAANSALGEKLNPGEPVVLSVDNGFVLSARELVGGWLLDIGVEPLAVPPLMDNVVGPLAMALDSYASYVSASRDPWDGEIPLDVMSIPLQRALWSFANIRSETHTTTIAI
jgi:hypothetical protein